MRISDWSSDVCSSDLLSNVSIDFAPEATFALTKIVADIKRGEVIGAFPSHGIETEGDLCNHTSRGDDVITWGGGSRYLGNWGTELGTVFYETMSAQGYRSAEHTSELQSLMRTSYAVFSVTKTRQN